jgi:predicted SprT family Zn-dependent metalloprotease
MKKHTPKWFAWMSLPMIQAELPLFPLPARQRALRHQIDPGLTHEARALLRSIRGLGALAEQTTVAWNKRLRSTAGLAHVAVNQVELNPQLLKISEEAVRQIMRHELAHLVAKFRAGRKRIAAHGPEWRQACIDLGIPNESRCHSLPLKAPKVLRKHAYQCPECLSVIERVRPMTAAAACYSCCKKFSQGQYDSRFRFVSLPVEVKPSRLPLMG